jgi:hypothetical protein
MTVKAIETRYKGYRFRSRLEARWAVFFDAIWLRWEYEPEGFDLGDAGWYLPDFFVHCQNTRLLSEEWPVRGWWVEIKPSRPTRAEWRKLALVAERTKHNGWFHYGLRGAGDSYAMPARLDYGYDECLRRAEEWFKPCFEFAGSSPMGFGNGMCLAATTAARSARFEHGEQPA